MGSRLRGNDREMSLASPANDGRTFLTTIRTFLLTTNRVRSTTFASRSFEGVSGNDPKTERDVAGDRHGGAPKGERVGRGFARRDPRVTRAAHTRACRRDNDNKKAPVGAPPTPQWGVSEAKRQSPDAAMRARERDGLFDIVRFRVRGAGLDEPRSRWLTASS
jgi:hypothetical protein